MPGSLYPPSEPGNVTACPSARARISVAAVDAHTVGMTKPAHAPSVEASLYTPVDLSPSEPLSTALNLILIDNYDSFTWNVYQYLVLEGATVTVFRNDEISLEELIAKAPTQLVVSPGPGHPEKDAGISKAAIKYFGGRIPVLGVCMGEQCIYSVYGGQVDVTGEILHGKTSLLKHDSRGIYAGLPQDLPITRYHSLAGTHSTLPACLEVASWIESEGRRGVIMGVRHKTLTVEGVQFHPESILSAEGRVMIKNFLKLQGGTWTDKPARSMTKPDCPSVASNGTGHAPESAKSASILDKIFDRRKTIVAAQKQVPSQRLEDLQASYDLNLAPPQISFPDRLRQTPYKLSLMAEIKRASPSKGVIALSACAPAQAREYALSGASVISVLTEPDWFKGSIEDLRAVRQILEGMPNRPAVLRKEFIFDEYQILEARLAGADTVLLIVKMLDEPLLRRLYSYSQSLGMEPLVEVNNEEEMRIALQIGSKVIGVNNRNLTNFEVDLDTTSRLMSGIPSETIVCALSGISGRKDVEPYRENGVKAVLVGEALMRAPNTALFVKELLGEDESAGSATRPEVLVKICGTRTPGAAKAAVEAGADLIGMILVEGRSRFVPEDIAVDISDIVHNTEKGRTSFARSRKGGSHASDFFQHSASNFVSARHRALLVGVFQNQPLEHVLSQQKLFDLDIVQLHGDEPIEWASLIPVPVIRAFRPGDLGIGKRAYHALPLLDAGSGGSGQSVDLGRLKEMLARDETMSILLAGGLNADNVQSYLQELGAYRGQVVGVDVSSGVEFQGAQNVDKIRAFIEAAKRPATEEAV